MNIRTATVMILLLALSCSDGKGPNTSATLPATRLTAEPRQATVQLRDELGAGYVFAYAAPFACAGNISQPEMDRMMKTIESSRDALWNTFFKARPEDDLKVYLFKDESSYNSYCVKTFGAKSSSPYGFFREDDQVLVMNISTGGGTLVHEMVHALIKPDFPFVPSWLNEGLGSLYEQSEFSNGTILGRMNWRFPILMEAHKAGKLVPLRTLFATTTWEFYDSYNPHYPQARYFCMYMQEKGVLVKFYKEFRERYSEDRSGTKFMEEVFGKKAEEIDADWQKWIQTLEY